MSRARARWVIAVSAAVALSACTSGTALAGDISGRMTCAGGQCYGEGEVHLFGLDHAHLDYRTIVSGGSYTFTDLPAGGYKIQFRAGSESGFADEWHRDRETFEAADVITVPAVGVVTGVNADLAHLGSVSGRVTADGSPVAWVRVSLWTPEEDPRFVSSASTDADGAYALQDVQSGTYKVHFTLDPDQYPVAEYLPQWYNDKPNSLLADPVTVRVSADTGGIDASLRRGGTIAGQVSSGGTPLEGVHVLVWPLGAAGNATTDAQGRYAVRNVPPGTYRIEFSKAGFLTEFYRDKPESDVADLVLVTGPETVVVDAELAAGATFAGTLRAGGVPCPGGGVRVYSGESEASFASAAAGADGTFTVSGLPSGAYEVHFFCSGYVSEWYPGVYDRQGAEAVVVRAPDVTLGIDLDLAASGSISGRVTVGGSALSGVGVEAKLHTPGGTYHYSARTAGDGSYVIGDLRPGRYVVGFSGPPGLLSEWYNDQPSEPPEGTVEVVAGADTPGIDADLAPGGSISGILTGGGGAIGGYVETWRDGVFVRGAAASASNGTYTLSNLPTGAYTVRFSAGQLFEGEYYDDQRERALAAPVSVLAPEETAGIDADLARRGGISGAVATGEGPLASVSVSAWVPGGGFVAGATSKADGTYRIVGLPAGSYRVRFSPPAPYALEWYDDQPTSDLAQEVAVSDETETTGIDAEISLAGSISGVVRAGGAGIAGVSVGVFDAAGTSVRAVTTAADGSYIADRLAAGSYQVRFSPPAPYLPEWYRGRATQEEADFVSVALATDTPGVDADLVPGGSVSGTVRAGGVPRQGVLVELYDASRVLIRGRATGTWGTYQFSQLPSGAYTVWFHASGDYLDEWYDDQPTADAAREVVVTAPGDIADIDADLDRAGAITGRVTFLGVPVEGVRIELHPAAQEAQIPSSTTTDDVGYYRFGRLRGGEYKLRVAGAGLTLANMWYPDRPSHAAAEVLYLARSQELDGIDVAVVRGGSICGATGESVPVEAFDVAGELAGRAATASAGTYCITGLRSGRYKVRRVDAGSVTWYNNRGAFDEAEEVFVSAPFATDGIDIPAWAGTNSPPVLAPVGDQVVDPGATLTLTLSGTDPEGDPLTYSATGLPLNASLDPATGTMSWTPNQAEIGWYRVTFRVVDGGAPPLADSETVTLVVRGGNLPPYLEPVGGKSVPEGQELGFTVVGRDLGGDPVTLSSSGLPPGAAFDPSRGAFAWRPDFEQAGSYMVTFTVSDGELTDSETITIEVANTNRAPVFDPIGELTVAEGAPLSVVVEAADPDGDEVQLAAVSLPAGATFDPETGQVSWIPRLDQAGRHTLTVSAADDGPTPLSADLELLVTVTDPSGPVFLDDFSDGASQLEWGPERGRWSAARGSYRALSLKRRNLSRVLLLDPESFPFSAGLVQARVKLLRSARGAAPNAQLAFGYQDPKHFRWVKISAAAIKIGQTGDIGGVTAGTKKIAVRRQALGRFTRYTLEIHEDGWVKVFRAREKRPLVFYQFRGGSGPSVAPGGVGIGSVQARCVFDDVAIWDDAALPSADPTP